MLCDKQTLCVEHNIIVPQNVSLEKGSAVYLNLLYDPAFKICA